MEINNEIRDVEVQRRSSPKSTQLNRSARRRNSLDIEGGVEFGADAASAKSVYTLMYTNLANNSVSIFANFVPDALHSVSQFYSVPILL